MQDRFARNLETHYGSSNIPESSTKAPSSTLASRPGVSQGTENQDINTGSIFSLYSDNVERSDQIAQPQLVESHHSQQQHFNLHAQHNMMRSISPPPHNSFPLEKPSVQTNDFDFDKLTDYAAYCSLEVETELDKIPSNEENTSLRAEYFTPEPGEPLLQAVDRQATEGSLYTTDTTFHGSPLQCQESQIVSTQDTRHLTDEHDSTHQEPTESYLQVPRKVPLATTTLIVSQPHLSHAVPQASREHQSSLIPQLDAHYINSRQSSPRATHAATKYKEQHAGQSTEITSSENPPISSTPPSRIVKLKVRIHSFITTPAKPLSAASLIVKLKLPRYQLAQILAQSQQYGSTQAEHTADESEDDGEDKYSKDDDEYIDSENDKSARKKRKTPRRTAKLLVNPKCH